MMPFYSLDSLINYLYLLLFLRFCVTAVLATFRRNDLDHNFSKNISHRIHFVLITFVTCILFQCRLIFYFVGTFIFDAEELIASNKVRFTTDNCVVNIFTCYFGNIVDICLIILVLCLMKRLLMARFKVFNNS